MAQNLSDLKDLAAHKASAICSRDEMKDTLDVAFLTKQQGWTLYDLAEFAEQKFGLGTITEEKLLTELLAQKEALEIPDEIFLRDPKQQKAVIAQ